MREDLGRERREDGNREAGSDMGRDSREAQRVRRMNGGVQLQRLGAGRTFRESQRPGMGETSGTQHR